MKHTHTNMAPSAPQLDGTFTVDVEDYFHVSAFASVIRPENWDHYVCRVEQSTRTILELAAKHSTSGTFFILGWVADRYPQLVREIQSAGHEIGCHSYWHQLIYELGPQRFRSDLIKARDCLQWITGSPVKLHRAPSFSITEKSLWALDILIEEGFQIDSSIYPVHHDRYGIPGSPTSPHIIATRVGQIHEFPGMTCNVAGMTVPVGGGGYLRLFPWAVTSRLLHQIRKQQRPLNVYLGSGCGSTANCRFSEVTLSTLSKPENDGTQVVKNVDRVSTWRDDRRFDQALERAQRCVRRPYRDVFRHDGCQQLKYLCTQKKNSNSPQGIRLR